MYMPSVHCVSYGECPWGGHYEARSVEVRITAHDGTIIISDVPQGACPNCGARVYKVAVLERIEAVMRSARDPGKHAQRLV